MSKKRVRTTSTGGMAGGGASAAVAEAARTKVNGARYVHFVHSVERLDVKRGWGELLMPFSCSSIEWLPKNSIQKSKPVQGQISVTPVVSLFVITW